MTIESLRMNMMFALNDFFLFEHKIICIYFIRKNDLRRVRNFPKFVIFLKDSILQNSATPSVLISIVFMRFSSIKKTILQKSTLVERVCNLTTFLCNFFWSGKETISCSNGSPNYKSRMSFVIWAFADTKVKQM